MTKEIKIEKKILSKNDQMAAELRKLFARKRLLVVNLLSSPGSGKTTLLEKTIEALGSSLRLAVIAGDLQTERDAERVRKMGATATQIETGGACHLDAGMVAKALERLELDNMDVLFIENVGNLVCPAAFDVGDDFTVVLVSVPEGDDKPGKYPTAFRKADLVVLNKIDLVPYTNFSAQRFKTDVRKIRPDLDVLEMSCTKEEGMEAWLQWLKTKMECKKGSAQ